MKLLGRLQKLELTLKPKASRCNPTVFIVEPAELLHAHFDIDTYSPSGEELEAYLGQVKDGGQCQGCNGSCAIDWSAAGFMNFSQTGQCRSSVAERQTHFMFCATAEIPELTKRIMNGERTE